MAERVTIEIVAVDMAGSVIQGITGGIVEGFGKLATAAVATFVAAVSGAVVALGELAEAGGEAELVQARFNSLVDSSNLSGFKDEMIDFATALAKVTRFEDENILEAQALLATYTEIGEEAFPTVLEATLDLAEFMKTDATSAAQSLGRAFSDIEGGSLSLLKRSRLLTAEQVEMAEKMAESGDVAGAQALVIEALDQKIGGLAETMGDTFEGQKTIFMNALNDIKEELGTQLLPVLTPIVERFTELATKYAPMLSEAFERYVIPVVEKSAEVFEGLLDALDEGRIVEFFEGVDWKGAVKSMLDNIADAFRGTGAEWAQVTNQLIVKFDDAIDWSVLGPAMVEGFQVEVIPFLRDYFSNLDWKDVFFAVSPLDEFGELFSGFDWATIINNMMTNLSRAITGKISLVRNAFVSSFNEIVAGVMGVLAPFPAMVIAQIITWVSPIYNALSLIVKAFFNSFQLAAQQAIAALEGMKQAVFNAVKNFIAYIRSAITDLSISIKVNIPNFAALAEKIADGMAMVNAALNGGGTKGGKSTGGGSGQKTGSGRAAGGPVTAGRTYLVGEQGMELFTPNQSGTITPNNKLGGGDLTFVYAPQMSLGNRYEFEQQILPVMDKWWRNQKMGFA
jgi:hypothetical protein